MINGQMQSQNPSFADLVSVKNNSRNQQVAAVYAADSNSLELAGQRVKEALRGNSASIPRPQRFAALS